MVSRKFVDPLVMRTFDTTLNIVQALKELLNFRCCEFVIVPNSKICQGGGALRVGDDFGSAFILGDCMHGPACLGGIIRDVSNILEFFVEQ